LKFSYRSFVIILILRLMLTGNVQAGQDEPLRAEFLAAEAVKWDINSPSYQVKVKQLQNYPLLPYFQLSQLTKNLHLKNETQIEAFLSQYQDTALDWRLRKAWLLYLQRYQKKSRFIHYFKATDNKQLTCLNMAYQLDLGADKTDVLPQVSALWLSGTSLPKQCDKLFSLWTQAGFRSTELIWQRIMLAQKAGSYGLVKYLIKLLPQKEKYLVTLWKTIKRKPKQLAKLAKFNQRNNQEALVLVDGLKRLIWQDAVLALSIFENVSDRFSIGQIETVLPLLVTAIARSEHPKALIWFANIERKYINNGAVQWRLASLLRSHDFTAIAAEIALLTNTQKKQRQWLYWQARAVEYGAKEHSDGQTIYQELAQQRSYYGFLAAAKIGDKSVLNHEPINMSAHQIEGFQSYPAAQRALELYRLNRLTQARREWRYWMSELNSSQQVVAAKWAHLQGWFDRGIYSLTQVGALNDIDVRFPMPYQSLFQPLAKKYAVDEAWAYAIARKESIFMTDATSSVGALGLMQVRPMTANYLNKTKLKRHQILDRETNIELGIKYLQYLLIKFDNNIVLATAAYNAGPKRVKRWLQAEPKLAADAWIETIPYKETREYVKSVLAFTEIYQRKQQRGDSPFVELTSMMID